jgi:hypothetical protein
MKQKRHQTEDSRPQAVDESQQTTLNRHQKTEKQCRVEDVRRGGEK